MLMIWVSNREAFDPLTVNAVICITRCEQ